MSSQDSHPSSRLSPSVHSLVERKMASPADAPPPLPAKTEDAPPIYQRTDTGSSLTPVEMPVPRPALPSSQSSELAYAALAPTSSRAIPAPAPLHSRPSAGEVSIPFYSNPPPNPDDPSLGLDKKLLIATSPSAISHSSHAAAGLQEANASSTSSADRKSSRYACLTLLSNDKLAATNFAPDMVHSIDEVIRQKWAKGVAKHAFEDEYWGWQLEGKPCTCSMLHDNDMLIIMTS